MSKFASLEEFVSKHPLVDHAKGEIKTVHYDYLIVGSGLYGSTFARLLTDSGKKCLVVDKRSHVGGNIYTEEVQGINVHKYGAHIFHTSNKDVWDFVNRYVTFNRYTNSPVANYKGKLYNLPFNMNTFYEMWGVTRPEEAASIIEKQKEESGIKEITNLEEQAISLVGKDIYETLIKDYTAKQWGRSCTELPSFIIKRLPVRFTFDNNYFNDAYQGIPIGGYNKLIDALLEGSDVVLGTDYFLNKEYLMSLAPDRVIYTGPIDEYFGFCYGPLEYRTVEFVNEELPVQNYQGNAVINYTSMDEKFTRIIEHKHFESESPHYGDNFTVISKEYSTEWKKGSEPFYPINDKANGDLYQKYKALGDQEEDVLFGGRLGLYKYFDMDDVIQKVFEDYEGEKVYFSKYESKTMEERL